MYVPLSELTFATNTGTTSHLIARSNALGCTDEMFLAMIFFSRMRGELLQQLIIFNHPLSTNLPFTHLWNVSSRAALGQKPPSQL